MARINKKLWQGDLTLGVPVNPDQVLAKLLNWQRGQNQRTASCQYPEPINLTAATAWTKLSRVNLHRYEFIYKDPITKLWIRTVAVNEVGVDNLDHWRDLQFSLGAKMVWTNRLAEAARPQPTLNDRDDEPGTRNSGLDPISLTVRLQQMNKYQIGDYNMVQAMPDKFKFNDSENIQVIKRPRHRRGTFTGAGSGNTKPIRTPWGVFASATIAAQAKDISLTWVATRARKFDPEFCYLSKEEYEKYLENLPNTDLKTEDYTK